jgi:hypothetical protein
MMTVAEYLGAVAEMHGLTFRGMARALRVHPTVLRRWRRGRVTPSWRRVQAMTSLWGGDPHVIFLGTVLHRYCQMTDLSVEQARRLCVGKARAGLPTPRRQKKRADRGQLQLPIATGAES